MNIKNNKKILERFHFIYSYFKIKVLLHIIEYMHGKQINSVFTKNLNNLKLKHNG